MENRAHAIIAVSFLVVFVLLAGLVVWWLSSGPGEPLAYRIVTREAVTGLAPQSKVEFKGLEVGHVSAIRFDPDDRSRVIVDFQVRKDTYVTHATYAELATQGLIGGEVLELRLGKGSREPLATSNANPALIPLRKGLLARLEDSAEENMQALHEVLASAGEILDSGNREHLADTIQQIDEATARLVVLETQLEPTLKRMPALAQSAQASLDQSRALLASANQLARDARRPVKGAARLEDTYQRLGRQLDRQTLPNLDELSGSLTRTSRLLEDLLKELRAKPQSLIFGPPQPPPGPGEPGFHPQGGKEGNHER